MRSVLVVVAFVAALVVAGCSSGPAHTATPKPSPSIPPLVVPATYADGTPVVTVDKTCIDQFSPLLEPLFDLHAQITPGIDRVAYRAGVQASNGGYDKVDITTISEVCGQIIGTRAEDALNAYDAASDEWDACLASVECSNADVEPSLQQHWSTAENDLKEILYSLPPKDAPAPSPVAS